MIHPEEKEALNSFKCIFVLHISSNARKSFILNSYSNALYRNDTS